MEIPAGKFKARCLAIMRQVQKYHEEVVITKFGKPIAKLSPIKPGPSRSVFGYMKGTVKITGDIVGPTGEKWEADEDARE